MLQKLINIINGIEGIKKTVVMFSLIILCSVLRVKGYVSGDNFAEVLKSTVVAFFSVSGIEHITTSVKEYVNSKGQKKEETVLNVMEEK